jgi:hypothetical protein
VPEKSALVWACAANGRTTAVINANSMTRLMSASFNDMTRSRIFSRIESAQLSFALCL